MNALTAQIKAAGKNDAAIKAEQSLTRQLEDKRARRMKAQAELMCPWAKTTLANLIMYGDLTSVEIAENTGVNRHNSLRRLYALEAAGLVDRLGYNNLTVWRASVKGRRTSLANR